MKLRFACLMLCLLVLQPRVIAVQLQGLPMSEQSLENMDGFRPVAGKWRIAGHVTADRHTPSQISTSAGDGILVNVPSEGARDNLFFDWEHGDLQLELEFMMPSGSNEGIYFQVPCFDDEGRQIANAKIVEMVHNGFVVHENVELTGPARAVAFTDEQATGPLMIQGNHGPVAIGNIRYKRYRQSRVTLTDTRYEYAEGAFNALPDVVALMLLKEGDVEGIDWRVRDVNNSAPGTATPNREDRET